MVRPRFDPTRPLVAARSFDYGAGRFKAGDPFPTEGIAVHKLNTLYGARRVNHPDLVAAPPPPEPPADPVVMEPTPGGWYNISAPWLDAPLRVRGKAGAEKAAAKMRADGEPAYHHGVTLTEGQNGWWEITVDWELDHPLNLHGEEAARARAAELRAAGPPPDPRTEVTITEDGDDFLVNAPWIEEALRFEDRADAETQVEIFRSDGPPEGWEPAPEPA